MAKNNSRKWPTGLPLVDSLRSCMLQRVPDGALPSGVSSLPYDAAELIHDLYDALDELLPTVGSPVPLPDAAKRVRKAVAAIAKARGEQVSA